MLRKGLLAKTVTEAVPLVFSANWGIEMSFDEDLQHAFRVSYCLHPNREIAYEVTRDGIRKGEMKLAGQKRRPPSTRPNKQRLSIQNALLSGVFAASEIWEKDQESRRPLRRPFYRPTSRDFLSRYVKTLIWHSMDRNSEWVSIAIGHFVYCYPLNQIARLSPEFFDDQNMWRTRGFLGHTLQARFQWEQAILDPRRMVPTIETPAAEQEFQLIESLLGVLAPYANNHPKSCVKSENLLETYLFPDSSRSENERIHALISPECAGWARFVDEFNRDQSVFPQEGLTAPRNQLRIPICVYDTSYTGSSERTDRNDPTSEPRLNPEPLSAIELTSLRRSVAEMGPIIDVEDGVA